MKQDTWSKNKINNEWVKTTLSPWSKIKKTLDLPGSLCRAIRINHNNEFLSASGLKNRTEKGFILLGQMFEDRGLVSFSAATTKV